MKYILKKKQNKTQKIGKLSVNNILSFILSCKLIIDVLFSVLSYISYV